MTRGIAVSHIPHCQRSRSNTAIDSTSSTFTSRSAALRLRAVSRRCSGRFAAEIRACSRMISGRESLYALVCADWHGLQRATQESPRRWKLEVGRSSLHPRQIFLPSTTSLLRRGRMGFPCRRRFVMCAAHRPRASCGLPQSVMVQRAVISRSVFTNGSPLRRHRL